MSLIQQLKDRVKNAMKSNNRVERDILRVVLGEAETLQNSTQQANKPVSDDQVHKIIKKIVLANTETLEHQQGDRRDLLVAENQILEAMLPKQLTAEEIAIQLESVKADIIAAKNSGAACGIAMKYFKQQNCSVDGNLVKQVVEDMKK